LHGIALILIMYGYIYEYNVNPPSRVKYFVHAKRLAPATWQRIHPSKASEIENCG
jgi:hypothetical protein